MTYARPRDGFRWESLTLKDIEGVELCWGASLPFRSTEGKWLKVLGFDERTCLYIVAEPDSDTYFTAQSIDLEFVEVLPKPSTGKHAGGRDNTRDLDIAKDWALMEALTQVEQLTALLRSK
jgi:hypothetical protein